ncbi:hypothetical protein B0H12DRAFT_1235457 [Mycena haematopus]|nr:hypothetical protein B0H12DRAFT_1235457 [Mycena haematopus]
MAKTRSSAKGKPKYIFDSPRKNRSLFINDEAEESDDGVAVDRPSLSGDVLDPDDDAMSTSKLDDVRTSDCKFINDGDPFDDEEEGVLVYPST